jgi:hypothetical protein
VGVAFGELGGAGEVLGVESDVVGVEVGEELAEGTKVSRRKRREAMEKGSGREKEERTIDPSPVRTWIPTVNTSGREKYEVY